MAPSALNRLRSRFSAPRGTSENDPVRLAATLGSIEASLSALGRRVDELAEGQRRLLATQAELQTRTRRVQGLTARTYEAVQAWPELLSRARSADSYEEAYSEPEPLISIPIPTWRSPGTLCEVALASVLAQSYRHWEAIVVGDHCTDDTEQRVAGLADERIRFFNLPVRENDPKDPWERYAGKGSVPRSVGIELAGGRWIAPLSHDDAWDPDHLESLLEAARTAHAEVAYSRVRVHDADSPGLSLGSIGRWPPTRDNYAWQASIFHGGLRFLRYDRNCGLASEANDWNLARRAWEAGVRFHHLPRETATLFVHPRRPTFAEQYRAIGLPPQAAAVP